MPAPSHKGQTFPVEILTHDEAANLFASFKNNDTGIRNRAILSTMIYAGLRCSEALDLRPCDFDLDKGVIVVRRGKGGRRRVVGYPMSKIDTISAWTQVRPLSNYLFVNRRGGRLSSAYIRRTVKKHAHDAGIVHRVNAHALRHTFACILADANVDIRHIMKALGHSNLSTTDRYLNHINPAATIAAVHDAFDSRRDPARLA